ncbi:MAG: hypothetical protein WC498_04080 [Candidatus Saccharimonadales bacterium]
MGHINGRNERIRRLSEVVPVIFADERKLQREFSRGIGARTFHLLQRIGQIDSSTFCQPISRERINTVRTSKPLDFTVPNTDANFSLRLEVSHMAQSPLLKMLRPRTFFGVGAELARNDQSGERTQKLELDVDEFVNGTSINNEDVGYSRGAVLRYSQRTARFINLLDFTEELLDGKAPTNVPEESIIFSAGAHLFTLDGRDIPEIEA